MLGVGIIRRDSCVVNHPFRSVSCRILRQQIRPYLPGRFTKWGHPSYPENPPDVQKERSSVAIAVSAGAGASVRATAQARRMWPSSGSAGGVGADYGCSEPTTGARSRLGALGADRPGRDLQQLTALVIDLEGRVVQAEALVQHPSSWRRAAWQLRSAETSTWADRAGKPLVTSHTCRSWTTVTPGWATSASPIARGSRPSGAAS